MLQIIVLIVLTIVITGFLYAALDCRFHLSASGSASDFLASLMIGFLISAFLVYRVIW